MDQGPLVVQQIDACAKLIDKFASYVPVHAAFWLKTTDEPEWFLYLVSDQITDANFAVAYGEIIRICSGSPDPWLDPFQVKVAGVDDPIAKAVLEIQRKHTPRIATRSYSRMLGGISVEEIYIYPIRSPVP